MWRDWAGRFLAARNALFSQKNATFLTVVFGLLLLSVCVYFAIHSFQTAREPSITYEYRSVYGDGNPENELTYVALTGGASQHVLEKINTRIYQKWVADSCLGDPQSPSARDNIAELYKEAPGSSLSPERLQKMNFSQIRQRLLAEGLIYESIQSEVVYAKHNLFSVVFTYDSYCGGAHPNSGTAPMTFDLLSGEEINFADFFADYEHDKSAIMQAITAEAQSQVGTEECDYLADIENDVIDPDFVHAAVTEKGLQALTFGYPHVSALCEPTGATIPYAVIKPFLKKGGPVSRIVGL
jgi:hypothetical protein